MLHMHVLCVSSVFIRMLHLDVSKVHQVLHFPSRLLLPHLSVTSSPSAVLHPSQTAEGVRTRARALHFFVTWAGQEYRFVVLLLRVA
jgi:hypothetical protein